MSRATALDLIHQAQRDKIAAVMAYPGVYAYTEILQSVREAINERRRQDSRDHRLHGAPQEFPDDFLFALYHCCGIVGSAEGLAATLEHDDDVYQAVRAAYTSLTGHVAPRNPPSAAQITVPVTSLSEDSAAMEALLRRRVMVGIHHAHLHGNLLPGDPPDWTQVDERNGVLGDGVVVARYSDAHLVEDPENPGTFRGGRQSGPDCAGGSDSAGDPTAGHRWQVTVRHHLRGLVHLDRARRRHSRRGLDRGGGGIEVDGDD